MTAVTKRRAGHWSDRPTEAKDTAYAEPLALPPSKRTRAVSAWIVIGPLIAVSLGALVVHIARS